MAAMNEPAETALPGQHAAGRPDALAVELRAAAGSRSAGPAAGRCSSRATVVVEPGGGAGDRAVATASWSPQSRGSQAMVALLDPRPGERVLDLCAGPGIKTTAIAARMGEPGEIVSVETDPRRAEQVRELGAARGRDLRPGRGRRRDRGRLRRLATIGSSWTRPAPISGRSPRGPTRAGASRSRAVERARDPAAADAGPCRERARRRAGRSSTRPARSPRGENEAGGGGAGPLCADVVEPDDLGAEHPRLASRAILASCSCCPSATATTGFFAARYRRRDG